jgi:hypothetical protein
MRAFYPGVTSVFLLGCGAVPAPSSAAAPVTALCPELAPSGARPYEPWEGAQARALEGAYSLTLVTTSAGGRPYDAQWRLWLAPTDSAHRFAREGPSLAGVVIWDDTTRHRPRLTLGSPGSMTDTAEVVGARLYLGCHDCLDGAPYELRIIAVTSKAFWGIFEMHMNGSGTVVTDSTGRVMPNPAGHYCARRL